MPCYTAPDEYDKMAIASLETMLCGLCRRAEKLPTSANVDLIGVDPALAAWWKRHKAIDDRRIAAEAAHKVRAKVAKRAAAKLTPEERAALGINE